MMPKGHVVASLIDRVMQKVERVTESGCWIFTGATNEKGYGVVGRGGRGSGNAKAHRVTYEHFKGEIPKGLFVCHRCDVPSCCNPDHLFVGTNKDNMADCFSKGRGSKPPTNGHIRGSIHKGAKLTEFDVIEMRVLRKLGSTETELANRYGISAATAHRIVSGERWTHV